MYRIVDLDLNDRPIVPIVPLHWGPNGVNFPVIY